ncbi:MAG: universal stress protein [Nitrososphaerota archaeon]|jgi:nucleotide-binding universal stress UspA family protein|nr:universal stress protein [Nitrososphaerota archaeon]
MNRDLRDVVNKIIVAVTDDEPTNEQIADLAADLAAFFDASVMLLYMGKLPTVSPLGASPVGTSEMAAVAVRSVEEVGKKALDRMAEVMAANGLPVTSRVVIGAGTHAIKDITEKEQADLVILPSWQEGVTNRLIRVFSPSIIEDAACPVLVLKGNRWLTKSKAPRPGAAKGQP